MVVAGGWWVAIVELVPAVGAALHRRLADQLGVGADLGLQRPRPADRRRDRQRRRRRPRRRGPALGPDRADPDVHRRDRRPGRLAAAGGAACCWSPGWWRSAGPRAPTPPGRAAALGRLAGGHRADVQPDGRHLPRLLHGRAGAGDRRAGRHRRPRCSGSAGRAPGPGSCSPSLVAGTAAWACVLLDRSPTLPALAALAVRRRRPAGRGRPAGRRRLGRRSVACGSLVAGCVAGLGGPAAYAVRHRGRRRTPARSRAPGRRRWPGRPGRAFRAGAGRAAAARRAARRAPAAPAAPGGGGLFAGCPWPRREEHGRPARRRPVSALRSPRP